MSVDTLETLPGLGPDGRRRGRRPSGCWCPDGCWPRSPGRCRPSRSTWPSIGPRVSIVAGSARFTLPTMPVEDYPPLPQMPGSSGSGRLRGVRRGRRADRGRRRPRRHAADADRDPGRDRRRDADAGRHRPVPAGGARAELDPGSARHVHRGAGPGPDAGRRGQDPRRRRPGHHRAGRRAARPGGRRPPHHRPAAGRRVREVPVAAAVLAHHHRRHPGVRAGRLDQAGRAGHRPRPPPADAGQPTGR